MAIATKLSIVFLNFNRIKETKYTVERLLELTAHRDEIEIIAVDNGSSDGTADYLKKHTEIITLLLPDNDGIAGYNHGFKQAKGKYILVLDDDSCPDTLHGIDHALNYLDKSPETGIIACRIISPDDSTQWSWHLPKTNKLGPSPFFVGCGFIIRTEVFRQIGWYPEDFFLYQNEIDVSFKTLQLGYEIVYDPICIIRHRGIPNQRPGWRRVFYPTRNTLWLIRQYYPQPIAAYMIFSRLIIGLVRALQFGELPQYFKAAQSGLMINVNKTVLSSDLRNRFSPFWVQNSLLHQILRVHF